jgi:hypothetical protein
MYICRAHPKSTHPPSFFSFFPRPVFLLHFQAFLSKWSSKTPKKRFKKNDVENDLQKNEKISISFFPGRERAAERGLILIEATYRNGIHGSH